MNVVQCLLYQVSRICTSRACMDQRDLQKKRSAPSSESRNDIIISDHSTDTAFIHPRPKKEDSANDRQYFTEPLSKTIYHSRRLNMPVM